ncbi:chromobox protein homolog 1 [Drosophila obscura]|uniref:chromobox protein homolog 1 n=1 Tax=Drosophila obscura TaxID=7282 RepID=UPI001BB18AD5|nr:chromobox protein homolog 1 [Drosophila obscura]
MGKSDKAKGHSSSSLEMMILATEHTEYVVEKIIGLRVRQGKVEYLVKWLNFPEEDNTWEFPSSLNCDRLIAAYHHQPLINHDLNELYEGKAKRLKVDPTAVIDNPFCWGFEAKHILEAFKQGEQISFLIKFRDLVLPQMVPSYVAYVEIPQMVFKFYENKCTFEKLYEH